MNCFGEVYSGYNGYLVSGLVVIIFNSCSNMTEMAELGLDISARRRCRGHIGASVMKLDMCISALELKEDVSERDKAFVSKLEKEIESLDEQHRKLHLAVLDLIT